MQICVLNGSPKGKYSITLQTVLYLEKKFPEDTFEILHVGQKIKTYEKDFSEPKEAIGRADLILFAYPVYTFMAPYQMHRFIELIKESGISLQGKFGAQITTSKHFYDVTAHEYIKANCNDMGMYYLDGLSADMEDLLSEKGRGEAVSFFRYVHYLAARGIYEVPKVAAKGKAEYVPQFSPVERSEGYDTVIVTNMEKDDAALGAMIKDFEAVYPYPTRIVNIAEYPFRGGCLGCLSCATNGKCIYQDGFDTFLREKIQNADAIVYAFSVKDHSMGADFKRYDDRQFCNGHRTVTVGMPVGYLIGGQLDGEENLVTVLKARAEVGHNFLAGLANDSKGIAMLSEKLCYALQNHYVMPQNFYGVGGMKIFRDLIYTVRGMMRADYKFYKANKMLDFPQKQKGTILKMKLVGLLISNPKIKAKMGNKMNEGMIAPYQKAILKDAQK